MSIFVDPTSNMIFNKNITETNMRWFYIFHIKQNEEFQGQRYYIVKINTYLVLVNPCLHRPAWAGNRNNCLPFNLLLPVSY